jgi:hypothetical protein
MDAWQLVTTAETARKFEHVVLQVAKVPDIAVIYTKVPLAMDH